MEIKIVEDLTRWEDEGGAAWPPAEEELSPEKRPAAVPREPADSPPTPGLPRPGEPPSL